MERLNGSVGYVPVPLRNMKEICEAFGVGPKTVKSWLKMGAPITTEGSGSRLRYSSEISRLVLWREQASFLRH